MWVRCLLMVATECMRMPVLVKNTFLKNERTLSRKMVEMVMSLALEKTMLKGQILSCYMSKIYWGHGIYGVESASTFYFGKHPSCLSLGESAMLAGLIPAPELRSPIRDPSSGKTFQARVLKRMVDVGFLDFETALFVVKQYLPLHVTESEAPVVFLPGVGTNSKLRDIWDWETESKIWEACEDMERWALKVRDGASAKRSCSQY
ncbi:PREDICTED: putative transglycosylase H16_A0665 [Prunus mume]|uniref:Transglycosylase H16_A0665 n=1 Tax=Prunus mume TaxID=102107 RepID=A0ABM1LSB3_PRUMU|nr:PREDICTED: putative transglycosylase H16_A0665 [Prunus mume]